MIILMSRIIDDQQGATSVEYGLVLALIVLAMLAALASLGGATSGKWNDVSSKVNKATNAPHG